MKVVIVDDQEAMLQIMERMLEKIAGVEVVGKFHNSEAAFTFFTNHETDLVLLDIQMRGENGMELARRLREAGLQMKLVFVTSHKDYALSAFEVYAYDFITKPISQKRLTATITRALSEEQIEQNESLQEHALYNEPMTRRELEVLSLLCRGLSNNEIAVELNLKEGTVKNHLVHIFGKLQVKNRVQAVAVARELKLIPSTVKINLDG